MRLWSIAAASGLCLLFATQAQSERLGMVGVNLSGAEYGPLPGVSGTDYVYPLSTDVEQMMQRGMNVFRLPFRWERLQRTAFDALDPEEASKILTAVQSITSKGGWVIVSPHNFGRYYDNAIGSAAVPIAAFASFWGQVAVLFRGDDHVLLGLMNEPHDMPIDQWLSAANAAIAAIRAAGNANQILVPGDYWTGGHSWASTDYGPSNAATMAGVHDVGNNFVYEIHQYFDVDFSGTHESCVDAHVGVQALEDVTAWLKQQGRKGFLAEFGAPANAVCLEAIDNTLSFVEQKSDSWIGWTYWAAGAWFATNWFSAEPIDKGDPPQLTVLLKHVR
jgi:endoglucanase